MASSKPAGAVISPQSGARPRLKRIAAVVNPAAGSVGPGAADDLAKLVADYGYELSLSSPAPHEIETALKSAIATAPDLVLILDFYHAASYLDALAKALLPQEEEAKAQAERWCRLLKEEGGATTLAVLENAEWPARKSAVLKEQLETTRRYFANNVHRMEYPEYMAKGWQIGSGVVESACKTVVGQRLKLAGMRWGEDGAHAVCHLRALYRSEKGQWDAFWERQFTKRMPVQQHK